MTRIAKLGVLVVCFTFLALMSLKFSTRYAEVGVMSSDNQKSFAETLGRKIRFIVVSQLNDDQRQDLISSIRSEDVDGVFDYDYNSGNLQEVDLVVMIMHAWSDAAKLPGQEFFSDYYDEVSNMENEAVRLNYEGTSSQGHPIRIVFYNLSAWPNVSLACLARDIVAEVSSSDASNVQRTYACD